METSHLTNPTGHSPLRILVVDDDVATSGAMSRILTRKGYLVREENDSREVIATALDFRPDVVVLDFVMPGWTGGDVAWQLTAHPKLRATRVVVTSGWSPDKIRNSLPPSVIPIMQKPIDVEALVRMLEDELRGPAAA